MDVHKDADLCRGLGVHVLPVQRLWRLAREFDSTGHRATTALVINFCVANEYQGFNVPNMLRSGKSLIEAVIETGF